MAKATAERRKHHRKPLELEATIERMVGRPLAGSASTLDLSEGGVRLRGPAGFVVGDVVHIAISRDDVVFENQGLVVGRQPASDETATLNVAFRTLEEQGTVDVRRLIDLG
jgi:hypothetical protein